MRRLMIAIAVTLLPSLAFPCQPNGNETTHRVEIEFAPACKIATVPDPLPIKVGRHGADATKVGPRKWAATFAPFVRPQDGLQLPDGTLGDFCCTRATQKPAASGMKDCIAVFTVTCDVPAWKLDIDSQPQRTFSFARQHRNPFKDPVCMRDNLSQSAALNAIDEYDTVIVSLREHQTGRYILRLPVTSAELELRAGKQRPYTNSELKELMDRELKNSRGSRFEESIVAKREALLPTTVVLKKVTQ